MSLQDILMPGEKILSECKPFYATSRRIIRYDDQVEGEQPATLDYEQVTAVELTRKSNHPMMILGTLAIIAAIFLTTTGYILITSIPALLGGVALLALGARGKLGYYRLHIRKTPTAPSQASEQDRTPGVRNLMESMGLRTRVEEVRSRLDYARAGSFIATIRNVGGELPEL